MNRLTLVPSILLIAIAVVLFLDWLLDVSGHNGIFLLFLFSVAGLGELFAFGTDIFVFASGTLKRTKRFSIRQLLSRLSLHTVGIVILVVFLRAIIGLPKFTQL